MRLKKYEVEKAEGGVNVRLKKCEVGKM